MANNDVDLRFVRDNIGHESLNITNGYLHSSDDERHRAIKEKHKIGW
jgi:integrase/recombinase XerD